MRLGWRLLGILALALFLRSANLPTVPMWDWDEGANVNYGWNLMEGRAQLFAYRYHFVPHPPLYFAFLAAFFRLLGAGIVVLRLSSILCSIIGLLLVYLVVRRVLNEDSALLAALVSALYPELVFWGRLGFANNLLSVFALTSLYLLLRFLETHNKRDLYLCCLFTGLCPLVEYAGVVFILSLYVALYWRSREHAMKAFAISSIPLLAFISYMLLADPDGFAKDAGAYFGIYPLAVPLLLFGAILFKRLSGRLLRFLESAYVVVGKDTPAESIVLVITLLFSLVPLTSDLLYSGRMPSTLFMLSLLSLLFIPQVVYRSVFFSYVGGYALMLLALNRWDHMSIPLHYLLACSTVFYLDKARAYPARYGAALAVVIISLPLAVSFWADVDGFASGGVCQMPAEELKELVGYINQRTDANDVVLTFSYLAGDLKAKPTVMENFLPYHGRPFAYVRRNTSKGEYAYGLELDNIKYAVMPEGYDRDTSEAGLLLADMFQNWTAVYKLKYLQTGGSEARDRILGYVGGVGGCGRTFVVLENPRPSEGI